MFTSFYLKWRDPAFNTIQQLVRRYQDELQVKKKLQLRQNQSLRTVMQMGFSARESREYLIKCGWDVSSAVKMITKTRKASCSSLPSSGILDKKSVESVPDEKAAKQSVRNQTNFALSRYLTLNIRNCTTLTFKFIPDGSALSFCEAISSMQRRSLGHNLHQNKGCLEASDWSWDPINADVSSTGRVTMKPGDGTGPQYDVG